jgi:hypothetical protein
MFFAMTSALRTRMHAFACAFTIHESSSPLEEEKAHPSFARESVGRAIVIEHTSINRKTVISKTDHHISSHDCDTAFLLGQENSFHSTKSFTHMRAIIHGCEFNDVASRFVRICISNRLHFSTGPKRILVDNVVSVSTKMEWTIIDSVWVWPELGLGH